MKEGHHDGAQSQIEQDDQQTQPTRHWNRSPLLPLLPAPLLPPLPLLPLLCPKGAAAEQLVVSELEVSAEEPAHQPAVEQEYRQTEGGDTDRQELTKAAPGTLVGITYNDIRIYNVIWYET